MPDDLKSPGPSTSSLWSYVFGGTQLAVTVLLGLYVGYKLDQHFGRSPWMTLGGAAAGFGVGMYNFLRPFLRNDREN